MMGMEFSVEIQSMDVLGLTSDHYKIQQQEVVCITILAAVYRAPKYKRDLKKFLKRDQKRPFLNKRKTKKRPKKETF